MIKFKKKEYSKATGTGRRVINFVKEHPMIAISSTGLGISGTNLAVNASRHREAKKYQENQLKAMDDLTKALGKVDKSLKNTTPGQVKPAEETTRIGRLKLFSIEDGGYKGGKRTPGQGSYLAGMAVGAAGGGVLGFMAKGEKAGGLIGAGIGLGVGALFTWLSNLADKSVFNSGKSTNANSYNLIKEIDQSYQNQAPDEEEETTTITRTTENGTTVSKTKRVQVNKVQNTDPRGIVYDIDGDPKKHTVSVLYRGNILMMYIYKPTSIELKTMNYLLDTYCHSYKNADYISSTVSKNVYVVEVNVIRGSENFIAKELINSGYKINILTGNKI